MKDINIGTTYGRLTVLEYSHFKQYNKSKSHYYKCICECGKETITALWGLKSGKSKSCGCYARDIKKLDDGESAINRTLINYSSNAKNRGYDFNLTKDEFLEIVSKDCYYCSSTPSNKTSSKHNTGDFIYNGIDRVDNTLGYNYNNCVPCCKICNIAKHDMTSEQFIEWIAKVYNNIIKK
jgi:hypothetical protein